MDELMASLQRALGLFANDPRYYEGDLPSATDTAVADLIVEFTRAQARDRELLIAAVPKKLSGCFLSFAVRMATLGVRERSEDIILHGLVALTIEDFRTIGARIS